MGQAEAAAAAAAPTTRHGGSSCSSSDHHHHLVDGDDVADDNNVLRALGYKPILARVWSGAATLCMTLTSMSILTSVLSSFDVALTFGGPAVATWGWLAVSACVLCVSASMAELSSAYPTSGGMAYWCYRLAGASRARFVAFMMSWVNLIAQMSGNAAQLALMANLTVVLANMVAAHQGLAPPEVTRPIRYGLYAGWVFVTCLSNCLGERVSIAVSQVGGMLNVVGALILTVLLPAVATTRQSASYVFTKFETAQGAAVGITSAAHVAVLGLLLPAWAFTGLDSAEYMSEETRRAGRSQPRAILMGCASMAVGGFAVVVASLFSLGPGGLDRAIDPDAPAGGYAFGQILYDIFQDRTGSPLGGIVVFVLLPFAATWFCCSSSLTYAARIGFAYGRDQLYPFGNAWWATYNPKTQQPLNGVLGNTAAMLVLGLPLLGSDVAFESLLSLSTIALFVLYGVPATLRILPAGRRLFRPGPICLGRWTYLTGGVATMWWLFTLCAFSLPTEQPVTLENLNTAPITLAVVLLLALGWWFTPRIGGRVTYRGPPFDIAEYERRVWAGLPTDDMGADGADGGGGGGNKGDVEAVAAAGASF